MLQISNISKRFEGRTVLDDVHLTIEPGRVKSVIGPSGSGKTTLVKIASLLEKPDSGSVMIDGQASVAWPIVTVVFQQLFIWPHLTLRENRPVAL